MVKFSPSVLCITLCACTRGRVIGLYVYCCSPRRRWHEYCQFGRSRHLGQTSVGVGKNPVYSMLGIVWHGPQISQIVQFCPFLSIAPTYTCTYYRPHALCSCRTDLVQWVMVVSKHCASSSVVALLHAAQMLFTCT